MRIVPSAVLAVVGGLLFPCLASAQAIYTPDPTPFERPTPLKIYKGGATAKMCDAIVRALTDNGFTVKNQDCDLGEFEATKNTNRAGESDKFLIWLERHFEKPKDITKLYFLYGRFETLTGHPEPVRINMSSADEDRYVGTLKDALTSFKV